MTNADTSASHMRLQGQVISSGVAFGIARVEQPFSFAPVPPTISARDVGREFERLDAAIDLVREHLEEHIRGVHAPAQEDIEQIIAAHLLTLDDIAFFDSVRDRISDRLLSADSAVHEAFTAAASRLTASEDSYMRARAEDFKDICLIIRRTLAQGKEAFQSRDHRENRAILVVPHLHASTVLRARKGGAVGFVTSSSALTSHGAILLRAAEIPALGGVALDGSGIQDDTPLLVDAFRGELVVSPHEDDLAFAHAAIDARRSLPVDTEVSPEDVDLGGGESVSLLANIDHPSQAKLCLAHRLRGVGLFRTELLVGDSGEIPGEESQYQAIRRLTNSLAGRPLTIRTFDFGAEKEPTGFDECGGRNPALGLRGIRRHLYRYPNELRTQLRAILRAATAADISILIPMVTDAADIEAVRGLLHEAASDLTTRSVEFNSKIRLGAMLEIPAAALRAGELLDVVDFLSVGTNDLVQYLTAADRENAAVADYHTVGRSGLYDLIALVMHEAKQLGRESDITVCGELASDPEGARRLVALGVRSLSVTPHAADFVRSALKKMSMQSETQSSKAIAALSCERHHAPVGIPRSQMVGSAHGVGNHT